MDDGSVIEGLSRKQKEGFEHLEAFCESLQRISRANYMLEEQEEKLKTYLAKLDSAKAAMLEIMNRTQAVQLKLNTIRQPYTPQSKALVQEGPFAYKCVHQGGVRYRDYPRHDAAILNSSIKFNDWCTIRIGLLTTVPIKITNPSIVSTSSGWYTN